MEVKTMGEVKTLIDISLDFIISEIEKSEYNPQLINEICKYLNLSNHLLNPILKHLLSKKVITDVALVSFLVPDCLELNMNGICTIRNATLKMVGFSCPNLITLNLSDCTQVCNAVVRSVLHGCANLKEIYLDRCIKITDHAFDTNANPFETLIGCYSLETISLQGCNQITGNLAHTLTKFCRKLKCLNLAQCKHIAALKVQHLFQHTHITTLNLSFCDSVNDESFLLLPSVSADVKPGEDLALQQLMLQKSSITDEALFRLAFVGKNLTSLSLQWCAFITDHGVEVLVKHCHLIKELNLSSCSIGNQSILSIATNCSNLNVLNISWCESVTDTGLIKLNPANGGLCQNLKVLAIVWCSNITDDSVSQMSSLPELRYIDATGCENISQLCIETLLSTGIIVNS